MHRFTSRCRAAHARLLAAALVAAATIVATAAAPAQTARLRAGFEVEYETFTGISLGGAIVAHPTLSDTFYAVTGGFQDATIHRIDLAAPGSPVLVADGADDLVGADNQLDSGFGSIAGIVVLPGGELVIVDNDNPSSGGLGDRVFLATDLNADGDFLDIVTGNPEITELVAKATFDAATGQADFTGGAAYVPPAGHPFAGDLFIQTSDGGGNSEIIRITDPTGSPALNTFFDGFDFGGGITSDSGAILAGSSTFPGGGSLFRLVDGNNDNDALDGGEATTLYAGTLEGCSAIALTGEGDVAVAAFRQDFTGSEFFLASASVAEAATTGLYTPTDFVYSGNISLVGSGAFTPLAGITGQYALMPIDGALGVVSPANDPAITPTSPHYYVTSYAGPSADEPWAGAVSELPGETTVVLASTGTQFNQRVWRFDFTDADFPTYALVADGTSDLVGGDSAYDNGFGGISDLLVLPGGEIVVSENADSSEGGATRRLWLLADGNADDDVLDVGEASELIPKATLDALTGSASYNGSRLTLGGDGALYVSTGDAADSSEVLRIADPAGTPAPTVYFTDGAMGGIDFGTGLAWFNGGLYLSDTDEDLITPANDRFWYLVDNNNDGDALDLGESTLISSSAEYGVAMEAGPGPVGSLWRSTGISGASLEWVDTSDAGNIRKVADTTYIFGGLAFTSLSATTFEPGNGTTDRLVVASSDFALPTPVSWLNVFTADAVLPVELSAFSLD